MFAIGDVHAHYNSFKYIVNQINGRPFLTLGDLVDRGNYPVECMELALNKADHCIMGNHDFMMGKHYGFITNFYSYGKTNKEHSLFWFKNGGDLTSKLIEAHPNGLEIAREYINKCVYYIDDGKTIFVHAGLTSDVFLTNDFKNKSDEYKASEYDNMMWTRDHHTTSSMAYKLNRKVVVGHTCINENTEIIENGNILLMDTGVSLFEDAVLSAYNVYSKEGYQIPTKFFPMDISPKQDCLNLTRLF